MIEMSQNPVHHGRLKHIEVRYHFIQNCVKEKKVKSKYVWMEDQLVDLQIF